MYWTFALAFLRRWRGPSCLLRDVSCLAPNINNGHVSTHQQRGWLAPNSVNYVFVDVQKVRFSNECNHRGESALRTAMRRMWSSHVAVRQLSAIATSFKIKGSSDAVGTRNRRPTGWEKRSRKERGDPKAEAMAGGPHSVASYVV